MIAGPRGRRRARITALALAVVAGAITAAPAASGVGPPPTITTESAPAQWVSGGDVLLQVDAHSTVARATLTVEVNGVDVSAQLESAGTTKARGVVALQLGDNLVEASTVDGTSTLAVVDHGDGPMLTPRLQPFVCTTADNGLGASSPPQCAATTRIQYRYLPHGSEDFALLPDPQNPPDDVATTSVGGETVPMIVRIESGTINRAIYRIAVLDPDPQADRTWTDRRGWNRRLAYTYDGGCTTSYSQGLLTLDDFLEVGQLERGYALASSTFNVNRTNCDDLLGAETTMMVKEHFVEQYARPDVTLGLGPSGGTVQQHVLAHNYPGVLDGLVALLPMVDQASMSNSANDCRLLVRYFDDLAGVAWNDAQRASVTGFGDLEGCRVWGAKAQILRDPSVGCHEDIADVYDAVSNPDGVRCTLEDIQHAIYPHDAIGRERAPFDNVGVAYGLAALRSRRISARQFLDLNVRIGGLDLDAQPITRRTGGNVNAIDAAFRTGRVVTPHPGSGITTTPEIIVVRHEGTINMHNSSQAHALRARIRAQYVGDNITIWHTPDDRELFDTATAAALDAVDRWATRLRDVEDADHADVVALRPSSAADRCWLANGRVVVEPSTWPGSGQCGSAYPSGSHPRNVAGANVAADELACSLRPTDDLATGQTDLTPAQRERLRRIFPSGVCDWHVPGRATAEFAGPWQSFVG